MTACSATRVLVPSSASGRSSVYRLNGLKPAGHKVESRRIRLNARGRLITFLLSVALVFAGLSVGVQHAESTTGPQEVISYTVRPGDTIWSYAASVTPAGGDVSASVDQIMQMKNLSSPRLQVGDRILVPDNQA